MTSLRQIDPMKLSVLQGMTSVGTYGLHAAKTENILQTIDRARNKSVNQEIPSEFSEQYVRASDGLYLSIIPMKQIKIP